MSVGNAVILLLELLRSICSSLFICDSILESVILFKFYSSRVLFNAAISIES